MNPVRIHEGRAIPRGHSRQNYFCDSVQCFYEEKWTACNYSLQPLTLYLTLTPIFSGRKAKINLHMTPKLTVVMPISCLLRFIRFPSPQNDAITLFFCNFDVCFRSSPAIKSFLELTDCCLVYPTCFAIRLYFLQSLKKDSTISFCWGHFFSNPSHFNR